MVKIEKQLPSFDTCAGLLGYQPEKALFLDIETTGFSPASTLLYLIGAVTPAADGLSWKLTQWMAENRKEEALVLEAFLRFAAPFDTLIHFNGTTFDLPYLNEKIKQYQLADTLAGKRSLDLYRFFRPLKKLLNLNHMDQKTLQSYLGQKRPDPPSGGALISLWYQYTEQRNPQLADTLLLHNYEDLCGMTAILVLSAFTALLDGKISPQSCRLREQFLDISVQLAHPVPQNIQADHPEGYRLSTDFTKAVLEIPVYEGELRYFFPNYRDYYYLPLEDQAVHRSVASFVDRAHRVPARPASCYIRRQGIFLLQPAKLISPVFVPAYRSRRLYFEYDKKYESHPELLENYVRHILKLFLPDRGSGK